jgi:hypothetical protein
VSKTSPTARTLAECKKRGWIAQVVEQTIPHTFIKRDLFGVIDIIAVTPSKERIGNLCCIYKKPYDAKPGEYTCATCGTTNDLFPGRVIGIQATSGSNHSKRVDKARAEPRLATWLGAGCTFAVWSWAKRGARGKRKVWTLREEHIVSGMEQS